MEIMGSLAYLDNEVSSDNSFARRNSIPKKEILQYEYDSIDTTITNQKRKTKDKMGQHVETRFGIEVILPEGLCLVPTLKRKDRKCLKKMYRNFIESIQDDCPDFIIDSYPGKSTMNIFIGHEIDKEKEARQFVLKHCDGTDKDLFKFEPREAPQFLNSKLKPFKESVHIIT